MCICSWLPPEFVGLGCNPSETSRISAQRATPARPCAVDGYRNPRSCLDTPERWVSSTPFKKPASLHGHRKHMHPERFPMSMRIRPYLYALLLISALLPCPWMGAAMQDPAPSSTPPVEFTIQSGHTAEIHGLEYASNGRFFASAGKDSTIKLWSPAGTLVRTIRTGFWVDYFAISRDNQLFFAASRTGNVFLLSLDGRVVHRFPNLPMREGFISGVAISDDNRHVAI